MQIRGPEQLMKQVRDKGLCTACGACVGICPYHREHRGNIALTFDCDLDQGQCFAFCPKTETDFEQLSQTMFERHLADLPIGVYKKVVASRAGEKVKGTRFQNGGTVSALIKFALDKGLINAAVLTGKNGFFAEPSLVNDGQEVLKFSSTKYMATPVLAEVNKAVKNGMKKLGVVGTGCQVQSLATMKANPLEKEEYKNAIALSIGLFCTWSLDMKSFYDFLQNKVSLDQITSMDVPPPPAETFVIKTKSDTLNVPLDEIRPLVPKGCTYCSDMTAQWADISVGANEGKSGWNTLVVRSKYGDKCVKEAIETGYLEVDKLAEENLYHLIEGANNKRRRVRQTSLSHLG